MSEAMSETKEDQELSAIKNVITALSDLDSKARTRVINYVSQRFGITSPAGLADAAATGAATVLGTEGSLPGSHAERHQIDIRTFAEEKSPRRVNERIAVVGYYLSELAPAEERRDEISAADITKYFKQAGFPLPGDPGQALVNAKNAGYLDAGTERGKYKLNPVGYNLVAHSLPAASQQARGTSGRRKRKRPQKTKKSASRR
jgi:hypothetical protein